MYDSVEAQLRAAQDAIPEIVKGLGDEGLLFGNTAEQVVGRISFVSSSLRECLDGVFYVQECTPEVLDIKKQVFAQIDAACDPGTILASSTSNLEPALFSENLRNKSQCVVCHPVNPPMAIPVVEVVPAPWTSPEVLETCRVLLKSIGQSPVVLKRSVDGFLVNRLQYALLKEALRLVQDGVASPQDVDTAVSQGLGLRWSFMGPFETIDLNAPLGVNDYFARYMSGIERVVASQDNAVPITQQTIDSVAAAMKVSVPDERRQERVQWRNQRLLALYKHKLDANKWQ